MTDIGVPLFKVDCKGAPQLKYSPKRDQIQRGLHIRSTDEVLERSIELAKVFHTDRVRCLDFWRLDDQAGRVEEGAIPVGPGYPLLPVSSGSASLPEP